MSGNINDMVSIGKKIEKDILLGVIAKQCVTEMRGFLESEIKQCVASAVDEWRGTYSPKYYTPSGGLKNMYRITLNEKVFHIHYAGEYATTMYRSPESVFNNVFKEGYHGGYWRVPLFIWKYRSPRSTVQGPSIFKLAEKNIDKIWGSKIAPKAFEIGRKIMFSYFGY